MRAGQVALSRQGRDAGTVYLVLRLLSSRFVAVVDGRQRGANNPKRKNCKHLQLLVVPNVQLAERLERGEQISDRDIQRILHTYSPEVGRSHSDGEGRRD